jgi:hypothetical protein
MGIERFYFKFDETFIKFQKIFQQNGNRIILFLLYYYFNIFLVYFFQFLIFFFGPVYFIHNK